MFAWLATVARLATSHDLQESAHQSMQTFAKQLIGRPQPANKKAIAKLGDFHFLNRTRVNIEDITILGCTLWRGITDPPTQRRYSGYQPIKDFIISDELRERDLDLTWLQQQLDACANGEAPTAQTDSNQVPVEEDDDIYNDVDMLPPPQPAKIDTEQPSSASPQVDMLSASNEPRLGPPRRIIVLTSFPPTYKETTHPSWVPRNQNTHQVEALLQNRQCWVPKDKAGNGVTVYSSAHGDHTKDSTFPKGASSSAEVVQMDIDVTEISPCSHGMGSTGDENRPPGIAAWAFGYSDWSCDAQYNAGLTDNFRDALNPKGKQKGSPVGSELPEVECPSCQRVPAPVRMISNQRGQQWERNRVPYVDVPHSWRAFDDTFVIDV